MPYCHLAENFVIPASCTTVIYKLFLGGLCHMIDYIAKAAENFCVHQIRQEHHISEGISEKRTLIAYIDIESNINYRVYFASDSNMMRQICEVFLMEEDADEATMKEMLLETANMIIGSAKVIASETNDIHFNISTPFFEAFDTFKLDVDASRVIRIDKDEMMVAIKEHK